MSKERISVVDLEKMTQTKYVCTQKLKLSDNIFGDNKKRIMEFDIFDGFAYCADFEGKEYFMKYPKKDFVKLSKEVLSDNPLFVLINSYTTGLQAGVIANILALVFGQGNIDSDEIGIKTEEGIVLPCGNSGIKVF